MGKVDFAFDHIKDNHKINELSVVLYTDSFFYGLWDASSQLMKTGYHPSRSLPNLVKLWSYYYNFNSVKVLSTIKPFVHLAGPDFEEEHFDLYFEGLYNLERVEEKARQIDSLRQQDIRTLHFLEEQGLAGLAQLNMTKTAVHISTAMVNYCAAEQVSLLCYLDNNILHVSYLDKKGFRLYNQYDCFYEQDYLYFLLVVFKKFKLSPLRTPVLIGGNISEKDAVYALLRNYFKKLKIFTKSINIPKAVKYPRNHYSDLHLCRTCV